MIEFSKKNLENNINQRNKNYTNMTTTITILPKNVCPQQAPIKRMKVEEREDGTNVIVYGRDLEAICPQCQAK